MTITDGYGYGTARPDAADGGMAEADGGCGIARPDAADGGMAEADGGCGIARPDAVDGGMAEADGGCGIARPGPENRGRLVHPGERVDDLERSGLAIIQNPARFCFGMDAVLLSGFARVKPGEQVLDLGTGTGIIPILLEAKTEGMHFTGLEIQPEMADMAARSVAYNRLQEKIDIVLGDIKEASRLFAPASFDVITSNPPYMDGGGGLTNPDEPKAVARHEVLCTFEDVARETSRLLKPGGRFYLVHRPRRLPELIVTLKAHGLEPKRMKTVHPFADREANMILIEAFRGGRPLMKVEAPVVVFSAPGVYSDEIRSLYGY